MSVSSTFAQGESKGLRICISERAAKQNRPDRRYAVLTQCSLGDRIKKFINDLAFENWAPRSSRAWRLQQRPKITKSESSNNHSEIWDNLERDILKAYDQHKDLKNEIVDNFQNLDENSTMDKNERSFLESTDEEISSAFQKQIEKMSPEGLSDDDGSEEIVLPLTASELRQLVKLKYGKTYDLNFAKRRVLGKTKVVLNIMWYHMEQQSFPMTEREYMEKLDYITTLLNMLNQNKQVRSFLMAPIKSKVGHHSRPIVGMAISMPLDLKQNEIEEWFTRR